MRARAGEAVAWGDGPCDVGAVERTHGRHATEGDAVERAVERAAGSVVTPTCTIKGTCCICISTKE